MVEPGNTPELHEIYRMVRENNQMLKSMRRRAFWGGIFKLLLYIAALLIPIWLYFTYLAPIVQQINTTLTAATGKKVQLEGQLGEFAKMFEDFRERFGIQSATSTNQ